MKVICSSPTSSPLPPPAVFICQFWHIDCLFEIDISKRQESYPHAPSAKPKGDSQHEMHISEPDAKACFKALEGQTSAFVTQDEQVQTILCCAQFVSNYWGVSSHHSHYMDSNLNKPLNLSTLMLNLSHTWLNYKHKWDHTICCALVDDRCVVNFYNWSEMLKNSYWHTLGGNWYYRNTWYIICTFIAKYVYKI